MGAIMTEKQGREYLQSIGRLETQVKDKINQILELRAVAESCTVSTDKENIQSSGGGDKMASVVGRIVDLENEIIDKYQIVRERKQTVKEIAAEMSDKRQGQFLTLRFVEGRGFYDTLMYMNVKDTTGKRINHKSVLEFSKRYSEKHSYH
jgi:hypothetical protein